MSERVISAAVNPFARAALAALDARERARRVARLADLHRAAMADLDRALLGSPAARSAEARADRILAEAEQAGVLRPLLDALEDPSAPLA